MKRNTKWFVLLGWVGMVVCVVGFVSTGVPLRPASIGWLIGLGVFFIEALIALVIAIP